MSRAFVLRIGGPRSVDISAEAGSFTLTGTAATLSYSASAAGLLFSSDWAAVATGTSTTSLGDAGKWPEVAQGGDVLEVVSSAGLNFPTTNVMRNRYNGTGAIPGGQVRGQNMLPAPSVGESRFYRFYWRNDITAGTVPIASHHPYEPYFGTCPGDWTIMFSGGAGQGNCQFWWGNGNAASPNHYWYLGGNDSARAMLTNHTYRIEWHYRYDEDIGGGHGHFFVEMRIYNESGTLVYDEDDFVNFQGTTLRAYMQSGGRFVMSPTTCMRHLHFGNNGPQGCSVSNEFVYYSGFEIRDDRWVGPYVS